MRAWATFCFLAIVLLASAAMAQSDHRLIVIVAQPNDPLARQENAALERNSVALTSRDVLVQNITPAVAYHERPELGVNASTKFEVLLVGKDGQVKLRRKGTVVPSEIFALIDSMPMRQEEMKQQAEKSSHQ